MDSIPSANWVSEIHKMVPDATVWESEINSPIAPSKVFHDFVLAYLEFMAKTFIPEQFGPEVVTLEGDGFGGEAVDYTVKEITSGILFFYAYRFFLFQIYILCNV
ncbi:hypothetical protein HanPI659440_Chr13g0494541 [Helianthus annuus]|nr:hypothetical protein HanPI659440_Chr13g0494541 [Helianthus annuus]